MAEIMLDFIQCHFCEKCFKPDDPLALEHWRECPNHPAHKSIAALLEACKDLIDALEPMLQDPGLSPSKRSGFPVYAIDQAREAIAKAEAE